MKINKILIANRGEIAVRIMRTVQQLGRQAVAVYAENDAHSWHVEMADEAYSLGDGSLKETYLDSEKIIGIALHCGADAIHPGYGFLSENPLFAESCEKNGLIFIGPDANNIRLMGNKIAARAKAVAFGLPVSQGVTGDAASLLNQADNLHFPVLVKAAAGGGGKGMRIVRSKDDLAETLASTSREALSYFGDGNVYIEQFIENPRHIEIQILADQHGNVVHLFERECSIQRRYQKIIEESPSPTLKADIRHKMGDAAVNLCKGIGYRSAGTIEFLVDAQMNFYFLEMNTRIQVEHPVSEMVTGFDLVEQQIYIAEGNVLSVQQSDIHQNGHAIECRIYAEDPSNNFMPSPGMIHYYHQPEKAHLRIDSSLCRPSEVQSFYDPMISKLVVWGETRERAICLAKSSLEKYAIHGIRTNISYLHEVLQNESYIKNDISTNFCEIQGQILLEAINEKNVATPLEAIVAGFLLHNFSYPLTELSSNIWEQIGYWRHAMGFEIRMDGVQKQVVVHKLQRDSIHFEVDGKEVHAQLKALESGQLEYKCNEQQLLAFVSLKNDGVTIVQLGIHQYMLLRLDQLDETMDHSQHQGNGNEGSLFAPMPGKVIKVHVTEGMTVKRGAVLVVVEAMKMENNIVASTTSMVDQVNIKEGDMVDTKTQLVHLKEIEG
jgi:3-methylcrotonyl-CoA carboxylase alpha subunit